MLFRNVQVVDSFGLKSLSSMNPLFFFLIVMAVIWLFLPSPKPPKPPTCKCCGEPANEGGTYCDVCTFTRATSRLMYSVIQAHTEAGESSDA